MRYAFWSVGILAFWSGVFQPDHENRFCLQEMAQLISSESMAIEERLLALVNEERESRGLQPLLLSDGLAALARRHSADLALSGKLSHVSSSGESLQARLVAAGLFFEKAGENVARSETYVASLIHRALMESSEHRENILDPAFDTAGVGAVETKGGSYFVSQDFVRAIEPLSEEAAKAKIAERIQEWRSARSYPRLLFREEAGRLAQEFAEARIAETEPPQKASLPRDINLFTVMTPSLDELNERSFHIDDPGYDEGGLGVSFGRLKNYPGGTYCIVLALYPRNKYVSLTDGERSEIIRRAVNSIRKKSGMRSLEADAYLAKEAARIATQISRYGSSAALRLSGPPGMFVFTFWSNNIERLPREIEEIVLAPNLIRIGLHALFMRTDDSPDREFLVVGVVR